jgi:hypothetical protein
MNLRSRQLAHRVTTRHLGAAYPFIAEGGLGDRGVVLGTDVFGGPFAYDPWELYAAGLLSNPNMLVLGEIGTGKSALKKSYLLRQIAFGRRAVSINAKREDDRLCEAVGPQRVTCSTDGATTGLAAYLYKFTKADCPQGPPAEQANPASMRAASLMA